MVKFLFGLLFLIFGAHASISIYYSTSWSRAYLHYNPDGSGWTPVPGVAMSASTNPRFPAPEWFFQTTSANQYLEFVTTDNNGHWDNNGGRNYRAPKTGTYTLKNGVLTEIQTECPAPGGVICSGNGTCVSGVCQCHRGYFGYACDGVCPGGAAHPCNDHGVCAGDGTCKCDWGFTSCDPRSKGCPSDVRTDPDNCGGCGKVCKAGEPGVQSAVCRNATCVRTCSPGWVLCEDGCHEGQCPPKPLPGCEVFHENICQGNVIVTDPSFDAHRWQTPKKNTPDYIPSYQDYAHIAGYPRVLYNPDHTSAKVIVVMQARDPAELTGATYFFDGVGQSSNTKMFESSYTKILKVSVSTAAGHKLVFDDVDFMWNAPKINQPVGDYRNGQKGAIIELLGWPYADIEKECVSLGQMGYLGVKIFPPTEQLMSYNSPFDGHLNPWYFQYQAASYRLQGRFGSRDELRRMINTCRRNNVRIYADAVTNHMVGSGNDASPYHRNPGAGCVYWPQKNTSASDPSPFYTQGFEYMYNPNTGKSPSQEFPAVPYGPTDFHCERTLSSWTDPLTLNAGWLVGLVDLNTEKEYVQQRIADFYTDLIGIGFSGVRVDAAKHIQPSDLVTIFAKFKANMGGNLPADFIAWLEVLLGGEASLLMCDESSPYNYGKDMVAKMRAAGLTQADVDKIKIWDSGYPKEPYADCGTNSPWRKVIQNDDHDQQTPGSSSRDMGDQGSILIKEKDPAKHRFFEVKLFTSPNGVTDNDNEHPIRLVLSSYYWTAEGSLGVPDGKSDCSKCSAPACRTACKTYPYSPAHDPASCGYDAPAYTRVHRDKEIVAAMRRWMHLSTAANDLGLPAHCLA